MRDFSCECEHIREKEKKNGRMVKQMKNISIIELREIDSIMVTYV